MACGEWLSAKAESDNHRAELQRERSHLQAIPEEEARHMKEILLEYGLTEATADAVNRDVATLSLDRQVAFHGRFELGIETTSQNAPLRSAATMWLSFIVGASIPLAPWILTDATQYNVAVLGSVMGSIIGIIGISLYQSQKKCRTFPFVALRQVAVTVLACGVTILSDMLFT